MLLTPCLALGSCATPKGSAEYGQTEPAKSPVGSALPLPSTKLPLPPGNWIELGRLTYTGTYANGGFSTARKTDVALALIESGKMIVYLFVSTGIPGGQPTTYSMNTYCTSATDDEDKYIFFRSVGSSEANSARCMVVRYRKLNAPTSDGLFKDSWAAAAKFGGFPQDSVNVFFNATSNGTFLTLSIFYFPERDSAPVGTWVAGAETPEQKSYVSALVRWGRSFEHWVGDGVHNKL